MTDEENVQGQHSIENAPLEVLYAAILADRQYMNNRTPENLARADSAAELAEVVEFLPPRKREQPNTLMDLATAAIGFIGFAEDGTPNIDKSRAIHIVREVVLRNTEAQQMINDYLQETFGRIVDFSQLTAPGRESGSR